MVGHTFFRRMGFAVDEPCCAKCGYNVKGLPSFICPECGSDLREIGIHTPGRYAPAIKRFAQFTWKRIKLFSKAIILAIRAGFFASWNAFRIVWRGGTRSSGPIRFTIRVGQHKSAG